MCMYVYLSLSLYIYIYICIKGIGRQGTVLKQRDSFRKGPCPVVICPYLCSSDPGGNLFNCLSLTWSSCSFRCSECVCICFMFSPSPGGSAMQNKSSMTNVGSKQFGPQLRQHISWTVADSRRMLCQLYR